MSLITDPGAVGAITPTASGQLVELDGEPATTYDYRRLASPTVMGWVIYIRVRTLDDPLDEIVVTEYFTDGNCSYTMDGVGSLMGLIAVTTDRAAGEYRWQPFIVVGDVSVSEI